MSGNGIRRKMRYVRFLTSEILGCITALNPLFAFEKILDVENIPNVCLWPVMFLSDLKIIANFPLICIQGWNFVNTQKYNKVFTRFVQSVSHCSWKTGRIYSVFWIDCFPLKSRLFVALE